MRTELVEDALRAAARDRGRPRGHRRLGGLGGHLALDVERGEGLVALARLPLGLHRTWRARRKRRPARLRRLEVVVVDGAVEVALIDEVVHTGAHLLGRRAVGLKRACGVGDRASHLVSRALVLKE